MQHLHFKTINSTQIYLKENLETLKIADENILISSSRQTDGIGRRGNTWDSYSNALAMSFTLKPNEIISLTPLEISLITILFFEKKLNVKLFLKWPNDILTYEGKKCGGVLCQYIDSSTIIVGLGINLGKINLDVQPDYRHGLGCVDSDLELSDREQEEICKELYSEILSKRYTDISLIKKDFAIHCFHINKEVIIHDFENDCTGIFRGIGDNGEAMVETDSGIKPFLSSSLTIVD